MPVIKESSRNLKLIEDDYTTNFMTRGEIKYLLTDLEEIKLLLEEDALRLSFNISWSFKFYVHLVIIASFEKIITRADLSLESTKVWLTDLYDHHEIVGTHQTRAILFELLCTFAPEKLSNLQLRDAYAGHTIHNDHCARLAWNILQGRQ